MDVRRLNTKDNRPVPDAMGRPRIPTANVPPATQPHRFPHQGRGRGGQRAFVLVYMCICMYACLSVCVHEYMHACMCNTVFESGFKPVCQPWAHCLCTYMPLSLSSIIFGMGISWEETGKPCDELVSCWDLPNVG